jgi:hypothetical protein
VPTQTLISPPPSFAPAASATAMPVLPTETAVPPTETETPAAFAVHNRPRTVKGGRTTSCDLTTNLHQLQSGCEIVSSVSRARASVMYTLSYPSVAGQAGVHQTFKDTADFRGHSLHIFNVPYLPPMGATHGSLETIVRVTMVATLPDGTTLYTGTTRFVTIR